LFGWRRGILRRWFGQIFYQKKQKRQQSEGKQKNITGGKWAARLTLEHGVAMIFCSLK
jgi:hypothetical protein